MCHGPVGKRAHQSKNMISDAAKGLGDRFSTSAVKAPAKADTAIPAKISISARRVAPPAPGSAATAQHRPQQCGHGAGPKANCAAKPVCQRDHPRPKPQSQKTPSNPRLGAKGILAQIALCIAAPAQAQRGPRSMAARMARGRRISRHDQRFGQPLAPQQGGKRYKFGRRRQPRRANQQRTARTAPRSATLRTRVSVRVIGQPLAAGQWRAKRRACRRPIRASDSAAARVPVAQARSSRDGSAQIFPNTTPPGPPRDNSGPEMTRSGHSA